MSALGVFAALLFTSTFGLLWWMGARHVRMAGHRSLVAWYLSMIRRRDLSSYWSLLGKSMAVMLAAIVVFVLVQAALG